MKDCQEDRRSSRSHWDSLRAADPAPSPSKPPPAIKDALGTSLAPGSLDVGLLALEPAHPASFARQRAGRVSLATGSRSRATRCVPTARKREPDALDQDRRRLRPTAPGSKRRNGICCARPTLSVVSAHAMHGADVSHRGGRPGFVVVSADGRHVTRPDYRDNAMFMTLGNLDVDPAARLLFPDWATGDLLQVPGRAHRRDSRTDRTRVLTAGRLPLSLSAGRRNAVRLVLWSGSQRPPRSRNRAWNERFPDEARATLGTDAARVGVSSWIAASSAASSSPGSAGACKLLASDRDEGEVCSHLEPAPRSGRTGYPRSRITSMPG